MKKLLFIAFAISLTSGVMAQKRFHGGGRVVVVRPPVMIGGGFYSPFYSPFWGGGFYGRFNSPFYPGNSFYSQRPTKLDMKIEDLKDEYHDRIKAVRKDKSVPRKERKEEIRRLKDERDEMIKQARKDYYESAFRHRGEAS